MDERAKIIAVLSDAFPTVTIDDNFFENINTKIISDSWGYLYTPLQKAVKMNRNDLVDILISLGADVNRERLFTIFMDHSFKNIDMFRSLLQAGATPIIKNNNLYVYIYLRYLRGAIDIDYVIDLFKLIMVYGGDINHIGEYNLADLRKEILNRKKFRSYSDQYRLILFLLENGLDISRFGDPIVIKLIQAYIKNYRENPEENHLYTLKILKLYIEYCADLNITKDGKSAVYTLMSNFSGSINIDLEDFTKLLLLGGANFDEEEKQRCMPWLIFYGKISLIDFLIEMSLITSEESKYYFDEYSGVTLEDLREPIILVNDEKSLTKIFNNLYRNTIFQYAVFNGVRYDQDEYDPDDDDVEIIHPTDPFVVDYVINIGNKYSKSQKVITNTGCKHCTLINIEGEYYDDEGRGENNSLLYLPLISPISFDLPTTLEIFVEALYRIKSNKWDTNYEMFSSITRVEINGDTLEIYVDFDHGS